MTLLTTIALLLVLAVRTPLRRWFGAAAAYQAWLLVPVVTLLGCLPTRSTPRIHVPNAVQQVRHLATQMALPAPSAQVDVLLLLWAAGALALAAWLVYAHAAFLRSAGPLRRAGGIWIGNAGPASVGLFRPIIIVPHDFGERYTADEQALVLAHERAHIARRDAWANLLQAAFQCVFWFHPLVHVAATRFRRDQELSCDALVMAQHPHQRRTYAEALLKAHVTTIPLQGGIHCHWQTLHPTKERFMQLQSTPPHPSRRLAGRCLLGVFAAGAIFATLAVRAEQPAATYSVAMTIDAAGAQSAPRIQVRGGEQAAVATGPWRVEMTVRPAKTVGDVWVASKIYKDDKVVGAPTLLTHMGDKVGVKVGEASAPFALSLVVAQLP
jgi:beta-lactamase regulating signal transducer with metallopeptidase domain